MMAWMKYPATTAIADFELTTYPGRREEITQGKSCQEIADLIDQYVKVSKISKPLFLR